jgi:hypothetical protein
MGTGLILALALALPAAAQQMPSAMGQDMSGMAGTTGTAVLGRALPVPQVNDDSAKGYLQAARDALAKKNVPMAEEALERAETRLLDRDVAPSQVANPVADDNIDQIRNALTALAQHKLADAEKIIEALLAKM